MTDEILAPEEEGFFAWLARPKRAVVNLLAGDPKASVRQLADFILNVPDAFIPGDVIPEISGPEDDRDVGDLFGMDEGVAKTVTDVALGAVLDPLSYVPIVGTLKAAGNTAGRATKAVAQRAPGVGKAVGAVQRGARRVRNFAADALNWHSLTPEQTRIDTEARAIGKGAELAATRRAQEILRGTSEVERRAVYDAAQGVIRGEDQRWLALPGDDPLERLRAHPDFIAASQESQQRMLRLLEDSLELGRAQVYDLEHAFRPQTSNPLPVQRRHDYIQRIFEFEDDSGMRAMHARSLETPEDLARALNSDPELAQAYRRDLDKALILRASEHGRMAARQRAGELLLRRRFNVQNPQDRAAVEELLEALEQDPQSRDFAVRMRALMHGEFKMDPVSTALSHFNRVIFKPSATVGVVVPNVAFMVRNSLSSIAQALSSAGARGAAIRNPKWFAQRVVGGVTDIVDEAVAKATGKRLLRDETNAALEMFDRAMREGRGSISRAQEFLERSVNTPGAHDALMMLRQGVLQNAVNSDDLLRSVAPSASWWKRAQREAWEFPAELNQHLENRMRAGLFIAARKAGQSPEAAAASVRNALLDYSVPTVENRVLRTWIPFGAFLTQTIKQHGKLFAENFVEGMRTGGSVAHGISGLLAGGMARGAATAMFEEDPENPVMPEMEGKLAFSLGYTPEGKHRYVASLGLPTEALGELPESLVGREWERALGSMSSPLVKTAYAWMSGREPYWGTPYGSYDIPPALLEELGMEEGTTAARLRQLMGTGAVQPLVHVLRLAEPWLDESQGAGLDALRAFTGVRVRDVNEDLALRLQLEEALREKPGIRHYIGFYAEHGDEDTERLLREYQTIQQRLRAAREAASEK
ncbi:MAG: hypothetical protein N3B15_07300 [Planctomycetota bacterium]|nr:hypothetical protein [Planctomycetota bacterium]